jgi:hypothetical protein
MLDDRHYLAFVEDVSPILKVEAIEGPDGGLLKPDNAVFEREPVRFRMSGVELRKFLDQVNNFEELEPGRIRPEQRSKRRDQLRSFYEGTPVPVIDIYASPEQDDFLRLRRTLIPSSWHHIVFREGGEQAAEQPVYLGEPYPGYSGEFGPGDLRALLPVPRGIEARLRDIFSLNHVPDAATDERPEGGAAPAPMTPPDDDPMGPAPARRSWSGDRGRRRPIALEALAGVQVETGRDEDDEEPRYLTQSP